MTIKETFGTVISNKMNKTITVAVKQPLKHKKYGKIINRTNKYYVHDPNNSCDIGDQIKIQETKPLSKKKRWKIIELIKKT
uniref:Small ribosomal subunit protein uS17c n=1 Tax=Polysiphonia infestans TaxID=2006978 RepID=A0A1Z1MEA9_9FLOR|nr:ribosomal protein S17 [Polysiphonia infestans]ARW64408.1 ribosomal protein S17 [Polysiphonia infestans]